MKKREREKIVTEKTHKSNQSSCVSLNEMLLKTQNIEEDLWFDRHGNYVVVVLLFALWVVLGTETISVKPAIKHSCIAKKKCMYNERIFFFFFTKTKQIL